MRTWLKAMPIMMIALCTLQCKKENNSETTDGTSEPNSITFVPEVQQSLIIGLTGTWSGACPPVVSMLDSVSKDHIVLINMHVGPSNLAPYYKDLDGYFKRASFPIETLSGMESLPLPGISFNGKKTTERTKEWFEKEALALASAKPKANTACKIVSGVSTGQLVIETRTRFFEHDNRYEYFLSLFIVEDDIEETQAGSWNGFMHNHVIRAAVGGSPQSPVVMHRIAAGDMAKQGNAINRTFVFQYTDHGVPGDMNHWIWKPERTSVVAVLSKRDQQMNHTFVNASLIPVMP